MYFYQNNINIKVFKLNKLLHKLLISDDKSDQFFML